ncbi:MAG: DUF1788 domain-containing protein [Anaerolineales bacterium]|jgi:hypothetical protein
MADIQNKSLTERYEYLLTTISSQRFLKMQGLGNEVPFFICPFQPFEFEEMSKIYRQLVNQLKNKGIKVLKINLYDLTIELLKERGVWDKVIEDEPKLSKSEFKEMLQGVLDPETHLIPAIAQKMEKDDYAVIFITGVGEVFPYIRSHTVLNNLQTVAKGKPTIMFFPGEYNQSIEKGSSLNLFGRLLDDNYYRAFNIFKRLQ